MRKQPPFQLPGNMHAIPVPEKVSAQQLNGYAESFSTVLPRNREKVVLFSPGMTKLERMALAVYAANGGSLDSMNCVAAARAILEQCDRVQKEMEASDE